MKRIVLVLAMLTSAAAYAGHSPKEIEAAIFAGDYAKAREQSADVAMLLGDKQEEARVGKAYALLADVFETLDEFDIAARNYRDKKDGGAYYRANNSSERAAELSERWRHTTGHSSSSQMRVKFEGRLDAMRRELQALKIIEINRAAVERDRQKEQAAIRVTAVAKEDEERAARFALEQEQKMIAQEQKRLDQEREEAERAARAKEYAAREKAAQQKRQREYEAAERKAEAERMALEKECGADYRTPRIGMTLARLTQCVGRTRLVAQLNRADGVISTYRVNQYTAHVMDGKVVAWDRY